MTTCPLPEEEEEEEDPNEDLCCIIRAPYSCRWGMINIQIIFDRNRAVELQLLQARAAPLPHLGPCDDSAGGVHGGRQGPARESRGSRGKTSGEAEHGQQVRGRAGLVRECGGKDGLGPV